MTAENDELKRADCNFGDPKTPLSELVEQMMLNMESYFTYIELQTEMMRYRYDCLIKQGFEKDQAERLCKYGLENPGVR
jgi:hypothetical protein